MSSPPENVQTMQKKFLLRMDAVAVQQERSFIIHEDLVHRYHVASYQHLRSQTSRSWHGRTAPVSGHVCLNAQTF